jgi:hypothetical protein
MSPVLLAMAAAMPGDRNSAEIMAEYAEDRVQAGEIAEALDWFSRILEGGEPELAPHAALRIGAFLADTSPEATQAAFIYAGSYGSSEVAELAQTNLEQLASIGMERRTAPATVEEVVGLGRWAAAGWRTAMAISIAPAPRSNRPPPVQSQR